MKNNRPPQFSRDEPGITLPDISARLTEYMLKLDEMQKPKKKEYHQQLQPEDELLSPPDLVLAPSIVHNLGLNRSSDN